jgi:hypothetical protein
VRYVTAKCFSNQDHITNFNDDTWGTQHATRLTEAQRWLNDICFFKRIRNFKVMCLNELLHEAAGEEARAYWGASPVHMTGSGYRMLALAILNNMSETAARRPFEATREPSSGTRAVPRQSWVSSNQTTASRSYGTSGNTLRGGRGHQNRGWPRLRAGNSGRGRGWPRAKNPWTRPKPY